MDNQKKNKEMKIKKINFKNAKRYNINKKTKKKNSYTPCLINDKKNSIQESSINNLIKKIEDKYSMIDNKNLNIISKRHKSTNKIFIYKFNNTPFIKEKTYKNIEDEKNNNCTTNEIPINTKISQINENNKKKSSKELLKRSKTVCNNNKKILKDQENEQDTKNNINININKAKKGKNDKKEIKIGKKKTINKNQKKEEVIEDKGKGENLKTYIKNKFLCCFLL